LRSNLDTKKNQECKYWNNFHGLNEWQLVNLAMTKATSDDDVVFAHAKFLIDHTTRMADEVVVGKYGAFSTNDERYKEGYYLVEWMDEPFTLQEDIQLHEYDPPARIQSGEGKVFRASTKSKVLAHSNGLRNNSLNEECLVCGCEPSTHINGERTKRPQ
jgi:hypothetical protein